MDLQARLASYADGIGPSAALLIAPGGPTALVGRAHEAGVAGPVWAVRGGKKPPPGPK